MLKYIPELIREGVIDEEAGKRISEYYISRKKGGSNKLLLVFSLIGALLIGLGTILIVAHNWDKYTRIVRLIIAFLPLVIGQIICGFTLIRKNDSKTWMEASGTFLFLIIAACISLVSQIYHIPGELKDFMFTWMLLGIPVVYIMRSSFASLLYIAGITVYGISASYGYEVSHYYWLMLLLILPQYIWIYIKNPESNFIRFHNLLLGISLIIMLGSLSKHNSELMYIAYLSMFGIFISLDDILGKKERKLWDDIFRILGFTGTMSILFSLSFKWMWVRLPHNSLAQIWITREMLITAILVIAGSYILFRKRKMLSFRKPYELIFPAYIIIYTLGYYSPILAILLINMIILYTGILLIVDGLRTNHIGIMNLGLIIIAILIGCRFFDTNFTFLTRGIMFVITGVGFFVTNYILLKNRRRNEI